MSASATPHCSTRDHVLQWRPAIGWEGNFMSRSGIGGSRRPFFAAVAAIAVVAAVSVTPLTSSASTARSDGNASSTSASVSDRAAAKAVAYWTPARMRAAIPYHATTTAKAVASGEGVTRGEEVSVDGNVGGAAAADSVPLAQAAVSVP